MERESFEDQEVAEVMNRSFIPVKVDREERPDVDHMYMTYCQAMTGSGGWPMTIIMTPDKQPFFAGTYFPKHGYGNHPGVMDLLTQIAELWRTEKGKVIETAQELYETIANQYNQKQWKTSGHQQQAGIRIVPQDEEDRVFTWGKGVLNKGYTLMEQRFDPRYGGFGSAPKFPSPHNLGFLLRFFLENPGSNALSMVEKTLNSMADGGIYDHIGFGFARYSTDGYWLVPHFEKMLYDNAGLALVYLEAYQLTKNERYLRIPREIFAYILRDMTSPEGGFYSAEDADSEGEEGKYYLWTQFEVRKVLLEALEGLSKGQSMIPLSGPEKDILHKYLEKREELVDIYCEAYGIEEDGNYEGKSIPSRIFSIWEDIASRHGLTMEELEELAKAGNQILFQEREKRIRPAKDDKILVSWNGFMIAALARGAQVLTGKDEFKTDSDAFLLAAEKAVGFILDKLLNPQGRLLARYRAGDADFPGYLDDYAFLIYGLLEVYTACGKPEYLQQALKLQEEQEHLFRDEQNGGYFFTGHDAEELLIRPKEVYDGAMPSGNSISASNLARFWKLTGEQRWQGLAEDQLEALKNTLQDYPPGYTAFLQALQFYLSEGEEVVLSGSLEAERMEAMRQVLFGDFHPFAVVAYNEGTLDQVVPRMKDYPSSGQNKVKAYLCKAFTCREPVEQPEMLAELFKE